MTKKECDRNPNYSWVKGYVRDGKRIAGYCKKRPSGTRKRGRSRSRSTSRRRTRRRSSSRPRVIYTVPASPRRVYIYSKPRSPRVRSVYIRPSTTSGTSNQRSCTSYMHPSQCDVNRCYWTGASCITK